MSLGRDTVNISGYQKFQYDFLTTGDSKERLEKAAEEVTGRRLVMTFDNIGDTAESKDKSCLLYTSLSLRLEKLENRLDKLCDGEISIQPRAAVQPAESTEKHIPAQSAKPVSCLLYTSTDF